MVDYKWIEESLNREANKILLQIKEDYYNKMSNQKKITLDELIKNNLVVIVNRGTNRLNTFAHGGRTLKDGKIHFYPDIRKFKSNEEIVEGATKILPHECFHYFIQPNFQPFSDTLENEMASFYTEGLVEKETRKFCKRHKEQFDFEEANYGFNINFVNRIQSRLDATNYEVVFSESQYLRNIGIYTYEYKEIIKNREYLLRIVSEIAKEFPDDMQERARIKMETMILQEGNANSVKEKLKSFQFITSESIEKLEKQEKQK